MLLHTYMYIPIIAASDSEQHSNPVLSRDLSVTM